MTTLDLRKKQPSFSIETDEGEIILTRKRISLSSASNFEIEKNKIISDHAESLLSDTDFVLRFVNLTCDVSNSELFEKIDIYDLTDIVEEVKKLQEIQVEGEEKKN